MHACFIHFHCLRILLFELMMRFFNLGDCQDFIARIFPEV
jgi:hypothetical protein